MPSTFRVKCLQPWANTTSVSVGDVIRVTSHSLALVTEKAQLPIRIIRVEKDNFILVDDVLALLQRAVVEPLPTKDDKGSSNRTKDGGSGDDFGKESIERDERRLTEVGRRTIELFVLSHIF
ncbi:hypothetical protein Tco_1206426, partial [Tanacetum coccineum]